MALANKRTCQVQRSAAFGSKPPRTALICRAESGPAAHVRHFGEATFVKDVPATLLRDEDKLDSMKVRFEAMLRKTQENVCKAVAEIDGTPFRTDAWVRAGGGGGITNVLGNGNVWEKAGANISVVYGTMPAETYRPATSNPELMKNADKAGRIPFFAAGLSSVMHPRNPHCPTMHFNYRYFETAEWNGLPGQWWFGGGTDITPMYVVPEDMKHFHGTYKKVCDRHDPTYFPKFKKWCDEYFTITHRGEMRGLGGIFFDDLNDKPKEQIFNFAEDCANHIVEAYCPIVVKHMNDPFTEQEKRWQQIRRGRYVEFNLIYDRGTIFGLRTGARTESMLMSMPETARWEYDHQPEPGSPEAEFMDACRNPRNWV